MRRKGRLNSNKIKKTNRKYYNKKSKIGPG
jgi:hypothetical protein